MGASVLPSVRPGSNGSPSDGAARLLTGWGRTAPSRAFVHRPSGRDGVAALLAGAGPRGVIARGLGRSYGDAAQNAGGRVIDATALAGIDDRRLAEGLVTAGAGVSLGELARRLVPRGWFLPVVPGTRHITIGGAVAGDIHGKAHHRDGSFARHVATVELIAPTGEQLHLTAEGTPEAFWATAGGMGLTGVIVAATLRLIPIASAWMRVDTERAGDLDDALGRLVAADARARYSVAWIDLLAPGRRLGRGVISSGDHARIVDLPPARRGAPFAVPAGSERIVAPAGVPSGVLRRSTMRAFNAAWFRRAPRSAWGRLESPGAFFWPLDGVRGWNRLYGPRGFVQYQLAVPAGREDILRAVVERLDRVRCPSLLGVLKRFGDRPGGPLSFPIGGWTLALDIPVAVEGLAPLLDGLDELVAGAGGRVYLSKDARLRPEALAAMYPALPAWRAARARLDPHGVMRSDLARRLALA